MRTFEPPRLGFFTRIVGHAGRVASLQVLDDVATQPFAPDGKLLHRRGPEGIARRHHHFLAFSLTEPGQLGDRRCFARAVDACDHHHGWACRRILKSAVGRGEQRFELVLDEGLDVAGDFLVLIGLANAADDLLGRKGADIGEIEAFFQFAEELLIDASLEMKQLRDAAEEAARLGQALLDLFENGAEHGWDLTLVSRDAKRNADAALPSASRLS